ncbi:MAG: MarR family winged helix-turn-helix transcriptional regulator [Gammaproteobacteria bacterium]|nr:MarR family winged helix-turn-helix transcriptional regulator [Gammaproteobacteria bacterium]
MKSLVQQHDLQNCACFNVRKSARVLTRHYDEALQPLELKPTQFTILAVLSGVDTITVTDLADYMILDRTTLTRNLRPLEKQGMIQTGAGEDRRTRMISLTKKGLTKLQAAIPLWKQAQKDVTEYLGNNRFDKFLNELNYVEKMNT